MCGDTVKNSKINIEQFLTKYWNYYISIENDLIGIERYVTFDKRNFSTFSIEFIKLYQNICSEIDAVCKLITIGNDMSEYKKFLLTDSFYSKIKNESVKIILLTNSDIFLKPFSELNEQAGLEWWGNYNSIKHNRVKNDNFIKANLKNVLNALAALYILELYFYQHNFYKNNDDYSVPNKKSKLFCINNLKDNVENEIFAVTVDEW